MTDIQTITCDDLEAAIEHYTRDLGYRLDMIMPADAPREVLVSNGGETLRLSFKLQVPGSKPNVEHGALNLELTSESDWVTGRAGMMYRDLIPDRVGGKVIASHIRIIEGGDVPDSVHYHKIDFQIIYCLRGAIRVVYEDQGQPFWLRPGSCVLQPPEIRHRVLEAEAGSEVIEVTSPAAHETWFDHDMRLPTSTTDAEREFSGQKFSLHTDAPSNWRESEFENILASATSIAGVCILQATPRTPNLVFVDRSESIKVTVLLDGHGVAVNLS